MKKELDPKQLNEWLSQTWEIYASHPRSGKRVRLYVNMAGQFKVTFGTEVLYNGSQMTHALEAFRTA